MCALCAGRGERGREEKEERCERSSLQRGHAANNMQRFLPCLPIQGHLLQMTSRSFHASMPRRPRYCIHMYAPCIFTRDVNDNETTTSITSLKVAEYYNNLMFATYYSTGILFDNVNLPARLSRANRYLAKRRGALSRAFINRSGRMILSREASKSKSVERRVSR
jgi:hypothetical protein